VRLLRGLWRSRNNVSPRPSAQDRAVVRSSPRVVSLSMVKNEQDIIEPFIRHNVRFLDYMIILDNASVDETRRIALDCAREIGNVVVVDSEEFSYTQAERMTRLLHHCQSAFFADFVLLLDADEFLGIGDRTAMTTILETIPPNGIGASPGGLSSSRPERPARRRRTRRAPFTCVGLPKCRSSSRLFFGSTVRIGRIY
jgi:Glycosyl transferase family 2